MFKASMNSMTEQNKAEQRSTVICELWKVEINLVDYKRKRIRMIQGVRQDKS